MLRAKGREGSNLPELRENSDDVTLCQLVGEAAGVDVGGVGELGVPASLSRCALRGGGGRWRGRKNEVRGGRAHRFEFKIIDAVSGVYCVHEGRRSGDVAVER